MRAGRPQPGHRHLPAEPFRAGTAPPQHQHRMFLMHDHAHTNTATERHADRRLFARARDGLSTTLCDWREPDAPRVDLSDVRGERPAAYGHGHTLAVNRLAVSRAPTSLYAALCR